MKNLYVTGYDAKKHKTVYFEREYIPVKEGKQMVELTLPVSPEVLNIDIKGEGYELQKVDTYLMQDTKAGMDEHLKAFLTFIEDFAQNMHYEPVGYQYASKDDKFAVNWDAVIVDNEQGKLVTPLRIDHGNFHIDASAEKLKGFTVPMFVTDCLHEYTHARENTKDETYCDLKGVKLAWTRGYMSTEIMKAFTTVFDDTPVNIQRINAIDNYLHILNNTNGGFRPHI